MLKSNAHGSTMLESSVLEEPSKLIGAPFSYIRPVFHMRRFARNKDFLGIMKQTISDATSESITFNALNVVHYLLSYLDIMCRWYLLSFLVIMYYADCARLCSFKKINSSTIIVINKFINRLE